MSVVIIKSDIRGEEGFACGNFHVDMFNGFMVWQGCMEDIGGDSCCRPRTASTRVHFQREAWRKEEKEINGKITFRGCKDG